MNDKSADSDESSSPAITLIDEKALWLVSKLRRLKATDVEFMTRLVDAIGEEKIDKKR